MKECLQELLKGVNESGISVSLLHVSLARDVVHLSAAAYLLST